MTKEYPRKQRSSARKASLRQIFHVAGMRLTRQRQAIFRELTGRYDHPDVDMLYRAVKLRIPQISLFTVYRTMNALENAGMVWRVATVKGHARYDGNVETHSHFLCETCGRIDDVPASAGGEIGVLAELPGTTVRRVEVMLSGECAACAAARKAAAKQA